MEDVVIKYTPEDFLTTTRPYDYLITIENPMERDREIAAYRKYAAKECNITAATFKQALKEAFARVEGPTVEKSPETVRMTEFSGQELALRCPGYYCNDSGIWKDSAYGPVRVLMHPMMPVARLSDYETHEHKTAIAFRVGNKWTTQVVSRDVLSSRAAFTRQLSLADAFVTSENCAGVITYLADVESANIDLLPTAHSTGRMGWHNGKFLPYETDLVFDGDQRFRNAYESITSAGDEKLWMSTVSDIRSHAGWIPERCALAAGFASVMLSLLKGMPFCLHLWSDESGTGKTVALMLAASIWGNPQIGKYTQTLNATNVGIEMLGGFYNNLPLCLDELCTRDNKQKAEDLVYEYCSNAGRVRGTRNGGIQRQQTWCNCMITTGETPILTEDSRAGAENRVLELEIGGNLFGGDAKKVVKVLLDNYGFAGRKLTKLLQAEDAVDKLRKLCDKYEAELEKTGATEKQSKAMAVILAADEFVADRLFNDPYNLRVEDVAGTQKTEQDVSTNLRAYEALMGAVASNNKNFEPRDEHTNLPLWGKLDEREDGTWVCVIRSKLSALLSDRDKGTRYNERSFLKWAKREGILETDGAGNPTKLVRLSEIGSVPTRCACIRMNAWKNNSAPEGFTQVELKEGEKPW